MFTLSPDQKGIETAGRIVVFENREFTLSPDQQGIETPVNDNNIGAGGFTLSPDQKGIETGREAGYYSLTRGSH